MGILPVSKGKIWPKMLIKKWKYFPIDFFIVMVGSETSCPIHIDKAYTISMLFFRFAKAAVAANDR